MDLTSRIAALVEALDLEPKSVHEEDKLRWSYEQKKYELDRQSWELERQSWDRERDGWKKLAHAHKSKLPVNEAASTPTSSTFLQRDDRRVTVFWPVDERDANGQSLVSHPDPFRLVSELQELARRHGQLSSVKTYAPGSATTNESVSVGTLQDLGVEVRSCPTADGQTPLSNHVYLDAMHFALASSSPPSQRTLLFVTNDSAYLPLMSKLRMIGCKVVLVAQHGIESKRLLRAVASEAYVLDRPFPASSPAESTPPQPNFDAASDAFPAREHSEDRGAEDCPVSVADSEEVRVKEEPSTEEEDSAALASPVETEVIPGSSRQVDDIWQVDPSRRGQDPADVPLPAPSPFEFRRMEPDHPVASPSEGRSETPTGDGQVDSGRSSRMASSRTSVHVDDVTPEIKVVAPEEDASLEQAPSYEAPSSESGETPVVPKSIQPPASDDAPKTAGGWDIEPLASNPPASSWEGEGWGVPAPPSHAEARLISTLNSQRRPQPRSTSASGPVGSTSQTRTPPIPFSKFTPSGWASSAVRAPPFFPPPPPPPAPEPVRHYPETHNRQPTYIHAPSPNLPPKPVRSSLGATRTTPSSPREGPDFSFLLKEIASFYPEEKPQRSSVNDKLVRRRPKFYKEEQLGSWKVYAEAAAKQGLVEMGSDAGGSGGGQWIRLTSWGQMRLTRG